MQFKNYKLKELLQIKNGCDHQKLKSGKYPVYGSGGIMRYVEKYLYEGKSILLPRKGTLSNIQYVEGAFWTVDTTYYSIIDEDKCNPFYLFCYLSLLDLSNLNSGTGVPSMTFDSYYNLNIKLPEVSIQNCVAKILYSLKVKIELNNRMNEKLERIAKRLYDYWFIQFDFPNNDGKAYKSNGGKMVYNEKLKRELPEGWNVQSLDKLCNFGNGINYDKNNDGDTIYKIVNVRDITASSNIIDCNQLDSLKLKKSFADRYLINKDDILIARSGTPGAIRLCSNNENTLYCGFIIHCLPKNKELKYYLFHTLKLFEGTNATKTGGSILQNVSQDTLSRLYIPIPNDNLIINFNLFIEKTITKQIHIINENDKLLKLREKLLPLLMNGQVTINK